MSVSVAQCRALARCIIRSIAKLGLASAGMAENRFRGELWSSNDRFRQWRAARVLKSGNAPRSTWPNMSESRPAFVHPPQPSRCEHTQLRPILMPREVKARYDMPLIERPAFLCVRVIRQPPTIGCRGLRQRRPCRPRRSCLGMWTRETSCTTLQPRSWLALTLDRSRNYISLSRARTGHG